MAILFILPLLFFTGGCEGSIYAAYRDVERLRPVQTLGIDAENGAVTISAAAGEGQTDGAPAVLAQSAGSVETALVQLQNAFPDAQPYYAHVQYILFGRAAAEQGMQPWLEWIERNPQMRLDAAAFVARDSAAEVILSAAAETGGTSEKLESLDFELRELGEGERVSVRALAAALADGGTGLCGAVRSVDEGDAIRFDNSASIQPAGFAVFRDQALCAFIEQENAAAVLLLLGRPEGARILLQTAQAGPVTVRLGKGQTQVTCGPDDTAAVRCEVDAVIAEADSEPDIAALDALLSEHLCGQVEDILALAVALGCDFLGLLDGRDPAALRFSVSVQVRSEHSYGLRGEGDAA